MFPLGKPSLAEAKYPCITWLAHHSVVVCARNVIQLVMPEDTLTLTIPTHSAKVLTLTAFCYGERQIRRVVGIEVTSQLVSVFVLSRLDYCNSLLAGLPSTTVKPLQRVQNAAVRLVLNLGLRDHVTPGLQQLHWLPVEHRITFKLCMLMHLIHIGRAPRYMADSVHCSQSWNPAVDPV